MLHSLISSIPPVNETLLVYLELQPNESTSKTTFPSMQCWFSAFQFKENFATGLGIGELQELQEALAAEGCWMTSAGQLTLPFSCLAPWL